jgi:hypothetical protein
MRRICKFAASILAAGICFSGFAVAAHAQYLIVGNDEKLFFDNGKPVLVAVGSLKLPGHPASMRGSTP